MKNIVLLGSTGSIGTQSLDVCRGQGYRVVSLAAHSNVDLLAEQARAFGPAAVAIADESKYAALKAALADVDVRVLAGAEGIVELAAMPCDVVVNAIVGIAGLRPTLAAIEAGHDVALANKETLVTGGGLVMKRAKEKNVSIFPIDSEHSAIWQCLQAGHAQDVAGVILTASGGPFFGKKAAELAPMTAKEALKHPNWTMGAKITIDSATLMNKGLELMEAMWLFDLTPEQIEIVVHRQSVVHSAVVYRDGSVIAQMGVPDMRLAIQYALTYPRHLPMAEHKGLSLTDYGSLTFEKPDEETFACLAACIEAAKRGGLAPAVVNGANEEAVALFLQGRIGFLDIGRLVTEALEQVQMPEAYNLEAIEEADGLARAYVRAAV